jgi:hypothetical protein
MELTCQRCKNIWNYLGNSKWYASCSSCKSSVKIKQEDLRFKTSRGWVRIPAKKEGKKN